MGIHRNIPVYSTAFLKSPIIVGLLKPCIYLPIHLISDYNESDMRYMLLHELQHYKHHDAIGSFLMNLAGVVYWFNPLVWYALKEMRNDREVACDTSVLKMLEEDAYEDYGNTLINFAEKVSLTPFPFAAGLGGNMKQMKRELSTLHLMRSQHLQKAKRYDGICTDCCSPVRFCSFYFYIRSRRKLLPMESSSEKCFLCRPLHILRRIRRQLCFIRFGK